ncbi:MAG: precorrin-6Y C5,15-methyltransferase (decarboxylating), partial [Zhongshania marina]
PPSAVFIGGGITSDGLLERCWQALSVGGRIVASAVTIEGEAALISACQRYGGNLSRIAVERSEALGGFQSMTPQRSVTIWHAKKTLNEKERY